jgi:endoglucanase
MKLGWNLGNSLDATGGDETKWGNPRVTPSLIQAVARAGFGAVRVPVTWYEHMGSAPNFTIESSWISRVEEVVKYVLDQGLYAILNIHHDGVETMSGPWLLLRDSSGQVTAANNAKVLGQFMKVWTQIANRFKGYNDHLIFESMNEIKVGYDPPKKDYYTQINALNQAFVETIRASAGNNPNRCLVVPGYNTNIEYTLAGFVAPNDTAAGKLILSAHYYDPWNYAGMGKTHVWGAGSSGADNWGQEEWVKTSVQKLKAKYIDKGIPVIWGEYGAVHQAGFETHRRYYMEYVTKVAHDAGIVPFFWDNGSTKSGEEAFGMFNRNGNSVIHPTILQAMMRAVTSSYSLANVAKP